MASVLLDTDAVAALVNRDDRNHRGAANWFRTFRGVMLTTEAVVTETAYVLDASREHQHAALLWSESWKPRPLISAIFQSTDCVTAGDSGS